MATILVVEDDADSCESMERFLSALGYSVICESDGRAALKTLLHNDPQIILLDLKLPVMNGIEFLKVVRSYVRFRDVPVFVVSGVQDETTLADLAPYKVKHIFRKGQFEFADVRKAIEAELGNPRTSSS
jgi:CheY-like chemotaxis protein